ncbi:MAG TPA: hypothetical protein VGL99_11920, partial [Chloroflexota bacterium]
MRNQRLTASGGTILSPITGRLGSLLGLTGLVADAGFWDAAFWDAGVLGQVLLGLIPFGPLEAPKVADSQRMTPVRKPSLALLVL